MSTLLSLSPDLLDERFARRPFTFAHGLAGHPLTSLTALEELAKTLPREDVEHNRGKVPAVVATGSVPRAEMMPAEIVRTIATNDCWIVLPVHRSPAYRSLLDELFDQVQAVLPKREGRIRHRQAVFFLASSGSTTPTHIDLEQGFLLHLNGSKEIQLGDYVDQHTAQRHIETFHTGGHRNVGDPPQRAVKVALEPGTGVHVPAFTPHLIHTGPGQVALSLAVALRTDATLHVSAVHRANARLRRVGLTPPMPGERVVADRIKSRLIRSADEVVGALRKR